MSQKPNMAQIRAVTLKRVQTVLIFPSFLFRFPQINIRRVRRYGTTEHPTSSRELGLARRGDQLGVGERVSSPRR